MAKITVTLVQGDSGPEIHVGYESDSDATAREHELDRVPMMRLYFDNLALRTIGQALLAGIVTVPEAEQVWSVDVGGETVTEMGGTTQPLRTTLSRSVLRPA